MTESSQPGTPPEADRSRYPDPDAIDCIVLVELVTEYLDGALEPPERTRLEHHLTECDGCTTYIEQVRQTIRATGHLEPEAVPPAAIDRLVQAYRQFREF